MQDRDYKDYGYDSADPSHIHAGLARAVFELAGPLGPPCRVLDIGCGSGVLCGDFQSRGCDVVGVDLSESGIDLARRNFSGCRFEVLGVNDVSLDRLGEAPFDLVVSTEVVEHLYTPRQLVHAAYGVLRPGGQFIVTTPYHGYLKNLGISLANHWDVHADPLWDGGHVKLFSRRTLGKLLTEAGFRDLRFRGVGRAPFLWMSMVFAGVKPGHS